MKNHRLPYYFIILSLLILSSCGSKQSGSTEEEEKGVSGVFVNGSDTLKISKDPDAFFNEIAFDLTVRNSFKQRFVFDTAPFADGNDDEETYVFIDSLGVIPTDLSFIYSYKKDEWRVIDKIFLENPDSTKHVDGSGVYTRFD